MIEKLLIFIPLFILISCGNTDSSGKNQYFDNSELYTGLSWFQKVLETTDLVEINPSDKIPEKFTQYLINIDSNLRIASEGEPWQSGCTPPIEIDSAVVETTYDENTDLTHSTLGIVNMDVPLNKLVYFGKNEEMAALVYINGGIAQQQHLMLFKIEQNTIVGHWQGNTVHDISNEIHLLKEINNEKST